MAIHVHTSTVSASQDTVDDLVLELLPLQGRWNAHAAVFVLEIF